MGRACVCARARGPVHTCACCRALRTAGNSSFSFSAVQRSSLSRTTGKNSKLLYAFGVRGRACWTLWFVWTSTAPHTLRQHAGLPSSSRIAQTQQLRKFNTCQQSRAPRSHACTWSMPARCRGGWMLSRCCVQFTAYGLMLVLELAAMRGQAWSWGKWDFWRGWPHQDTE